MSGNLSENCFSFLPSFTLQIYPVTLIVAVCPLAPAPDHAMTGLPDVSATRASIDNQELAVVRAAMPLVAGRLGQCTAVPLTPKVLSGWPFAATRVIETELGADHTSPLNDVND